MNVVDMESSQWTVQVTIFYTNQWVDLIEIFLWDLQILEFYIETNLQEHSQV